MFGRKQLMLFAGTFIVSVVVAGGLWIVLIRELGSAIAGACR